MMPWKRDSSYLILGPYHVPKTSHSTIVAILKPSGLKPLFIFKMTRRLSADSDYNRGDVSIQVDQNDKKHRTDSLRSTATRTTH